MKRSKFWLWYVILGFIFGMIIVILAELIALATATPPMPLNLLNLILVPFRQPLLWFIYFFPLVMMVLLGLVGNREDRVINDQVQIEELTQKRNADLQRYSAEIAKMDQSRQEIDTTVSRGKREWEATFDSVKDLIIVTDVDGTINRCNRATIDAFQSNYRDLLGQKIDSLFFGSSDPQQEKFPLQTAEMKFPKLEGWYEVSSNPLILENARKGTIVTIRNITDRKQAALDLQRQKQYYELLVRNSPIAIVTLNMDHKIVDCNPAFEKLFGYSQHEIIGQDLDYLISSGELKSEVMEFTARVEKGETVHVVGQRERRDGTLVDVEIFRIPVILWGKQVGILGLFHDISGLVKAQAAPSEAMEPTEVETPTLEPETEPNFAAIAAGALGIAAGAAGVEKIKEEQPAPEPEVAITSLETEEELPPVEEAPVEELEPVPPFVFEDSHEPAFEEAPVVKTKHRTVPIETIEGIGPYYKAILGEAGIKTTEDLLNAGASRKGREDLVDKTGISGKYILKWVNMADLMRVPGIGEEYSELLEGAGVDTVKELRNRVPQNLYEKMREVNEVRHLVRRTPYLSEVEAWVEEAKTLDPIMTY